MIKKTTGLVFNIAIHAMKYFPFKTLVIIHVAMSVQMVRSQALCLLERLSHLGPGARAAGERRRVVQRIEETRNRQAQAYGVSIHICPSRCSR